MENQNQRSNEETEIDLVELFWVLWRKLPLMIAGERFKFCVNVKN